MSVLHWGLNEILTGTLMNDAELDAMLSEIGGPCNFENMLRCFEGKMSGMCNDPDDMIINGILCHDEEGK